MGELRAIDIVGADSLVAGVWRNGEMRISYSLDEVRARSLLD